MSDDPHAEPPPEGLAPWEPWVWYGTFAAAVGALLLRLEQGNTHSHGVGLLVSTLMLLFSLLILLESVFVLFDIRGVLWKISGRPADQQLKLGTERKPWDGFSPRMWCGIFVIVGFSALGYGIHGLVSVGSAASRPALPALAAAFLYHGRGYYIAEAPANGQPYCFVPQTSTTGRNDRLPHGYAPLHPLSGHALDLGSRPILVPNDEPDRGTPALVFVRDGGCLREYRRDHPSR